MRTLRWVLGVGVVLCLAAAASGGEAPGGAGGGGLGGRRHGPPTPRALMRKFDTDGDHKLSLPELQALLEAMRARRAARQGDRQGGPGGGPRGEGMPGGGQGPGGMRRQGPPPQILEKFDANGDGQLDEAERQALREAIRAKRGAAGEGKGPRMGRGKRPQPEE